MRSQDYGRNGWRTRGIRGYAGAIVNVILIAIGLFMLTAGTYSTVESIRENYAAVSDVVSCGCDGANRLDRVL